MSVDSGWGRFTWGQAYYGQDTLLATGWGAKQWNDGEWGNLADETVTLTGNINNIKRWIININWNTVVVPSGVSTTSNVGSIAPAIDVTPNIPSLSFSGNVGSFTNVIDVSVVPTGLSTNSALGVITPADQVMGLTGQEFTAEQGTAVAPNQDVSPSGLQSTISQGTAIAFSGTLVQPSGFSMTFLRFSCCS